VKLDLNSACFMLWTGNTDLSYLSAPFHRCSVFIHLSSNLIILAKYPRGLTFIGPCFAIYFYSKTNQMHQCLGFILFWNNSTCFGRSIHPSSGVQDCTYSNRYLSNRYCYCLLARRPQYLFDICLLLYVQS
jgi:hypothetical protein